ncbi:MAG: glycosyltransferase family 2 protein [bacterium]|nr:glycosyltransferase family 2 protein [bacterium]
MNELTEFPHVAIVLVNYIRWDLTIECLQSLLLQDYPNYHIYIVDNDSKNASLQKIAEWLKGKRTSRSPLNTSSQGMSSSFSLNQPPVPFQILSESSVYIPQDQSEPAIVTLIQAKSNGGYAAGNNLALQHAFQSQQFQFYWLVNNDAVVDRKALYCLVSKALSNLSYGLCGSLTLHYEKPSLVQCYAGGIYNPRWAYGTLFGYNQSITEEVNEGAVEAVLQYINGASCLISHECIKTIGFLPEQYFLYFEDLHYSLTAKQNGFQLGFAKESVIYHRESTTTNEGKRSKSANTEYYFHRNRILFTKQWYPQHVLTVYLALLFSILKRILTLRLKNARILCKVFFQSISQNASISNLNRHHDQR